MSKPMHPKRHDIRPGLAVAALTALSLPCAAQEARQLEEVVVSAQRIQQSVQDVPISMAVVNGEDLARANVFSFEDTVALTPGISVQAGLQAAAIRIRGVGERGFAVGAQSVQVYVDQVARSQPGSIFSTLLDIQRMELLRGPQGTLYGANAPGGAYNISTRGPDFEGVSGYLEGSYSQFDMDSQLDTSDVRAAINIPLLADTLGLRMAAGHADSDGFITIKNPQSRDSTAGGFEHKSFRGKLLWAIDERQEILASYDYQDSTEYPLGFNYDGLVPGTGGSNEYPATYTEFGDRESHAAFVSEVEGKLEQYTLHYTGDFTLTQVDFIYSNEDWDSDSRENREPYPGGESLFGIGTYFDVDIAELRFSDNGESFDYIAGLYYEDRSAASELAVRIGNIDIFGLSDNVTESWAAFANFNLHLSEQWDLALGARYEESDLDLDTNISFLDFAGSVVQPQEYDDWSWSIKLRHFLSDQATAYLAVDHAYKRGGVNVLVAAAAAPAFEQLFPDAYREAQNALFYDPETSTAYEIGIKGSALKQRLQYSLALFYQQFDDHQITQNDSGPMALAPVQSLFARSKTNAEEAQTRGVEFELAYLLGEHWDVSFSGAYADPTAEEWSSRYCDPGESQSPDQLYCPLDGEALSKFPKWTSYSDLGYRRTLGSGEFFARVNWSWQSEPNFTTVSNQFSEHKHRFGFNFGYSHDSGFEAQLWGKNLTDEFMEVTPLLQENGDPALPPAFEGQFDRGREYGLTLRYTFQ